jgi:hypothetical protein
MAASFLQEEVTVIVMPGWAQKATDICRQVQTLFWIKQALLAAPDPAGTCWHSLCCKSWIQDWMP